MFTKREALRTRAAWRSVYEEGDYVPLAATGAHRDCVFAFARVPYDDDRAGRTIVTCVPRMIASLIPDAAMPPLGASVWADTCVEVPPGSYRNAFTGDTVESETVDGRSTMPAARIFDRFPVALLVADGVRS
jgi:(1->4)-alpha-D-glucan 1-alpha-D-glucosylmutase